MPTRNDRKKVSSGIFEYYFRGSGEEIFKGVSLGATILYGVLSCCIFLLILFAAVTWTGWWIRLAAGVSIVVFTFLQILGVRKLIDLYARKIDKTELTRRRYYNINRYLERIIQDSTDIIFTLDKEGLLLKFNQGAQMHLGYSQEEILGMPFENLFVNEADQRDIYDTVLRLSKVTNREVAMKTKTSEIIHLNVSMSEMKDESNQIMGMVVTAKDITEKKKLEMELVRKNQQLEKLAVTDTLTTLFNSRHLFEELKREMTRLRRNPERTLAVIMMDIDHFKEFNDTEGHQMGDQVLRSLAEVIQVCIRKDIDSGYRYGGDEFFVLLPDTDKHQARVVAQRITNQFSAFKFGRTGISIGIAGAVPGDDEKSLLSRADGAMYSSKRTGRSCITVV